MEFELDHNHRGNHCQWISWDSKLRGSRHARRPTGCSELTGKLKKAYINCGQTCSSSGLLQLPGLPPHNSFSIHHGFHCGQGIITDKNREQNHQRWARASISEWIKLCSICLTCLLISFSPAIQSMYLNHLPLVSQIIPINPDVGELSYTLVFCFAHSCYLHLHYLATFKQPNVSSAANPTHPMHYVQMHCSVYYCPVRCQ